MHNLLEISLAPSVPASPRNIPPKYNIITQLWTHAFHKRLKPHCRVSFTSSLSNTFKISYITPTPSTPDYSKNKHYESSVQGGYEALGDLARYRMAVTATVTGTQGPRPEELTTAAVSAIQSASPPPSVSPSSAANHLSNVSAKSSSTSEKPAAHIDDSPSPSMGLAAAKLLSVEPDKERWVYCEGLVCSRFGGHPGYGKTPFAKVQSVNETTYTLGDSLPDRSAWL